MMLGVAVATCPYCGESIELMVDLSAGDQAYVEDCSVCCRPIEVTVTADNGGGFDLSLRRGDA